MMKTLDLEKLWEVMDTISLKQQDLDEQNIFVNLLGHMSGYYGQSFESFLDYYSFKFEDDNIVVYNNDGVPFEDYNNEDYSYVPICLLSFSAEQIEEWVKTEIQRQLKQQEEEMILYSLISLSLLLYSRLYSHNTV